MIESTLINGLDSRMMQARLNSINTKPFAYATFFPLKRVHGFNWATLTNQLRSANVAADISADNATTLRKRRPVLESARGDIPHISISREMQRSEIKEYQTALAFTQDQSAVALVDYWGNDVDFCFNGTNAELEYIAWALLSNAGHLAFTTQNNATFANEFDLNYDVYEAQKTHTSQDWSNSASADVVGDLVKAVEEAKKIGLNPKFAFVNLNELYKICSADQIIKKCSSYAQNALGAASAPDLAAVNATFARLPWLNGLQLKVIDQQVTRELADGKLISGNPFADSRLVLTESEVLGRTQYDVLMADNKNITRAERGHTVVKKYSEVEPLKEVTIGEADAIPVLDSAYRNIYIKTDGKDWE